MLFRSFIDLRFPVFNRDRPMQDADGFERLFADRFARVVKESLIAWDVVEIICSHFLRMSELSEKRMGAGVEDDWFKSFIYTRATKLARWRISLESSFRR